MKKEWISGYFKTQKVKGKDVKIWVNGYTKKIKVKKQIGQLIAKIMLEDVDLWKGKYFYSKTYATFYLSGYIIIIGILLLKWIWSW